MRSAAALVISASLALPSSIACATAKSVVEIPSCADRVEVSGQVQRLSSTRFELDHTFDLMLSRTQLSFQSPSGVREIIVANTQPEPLRLFFGVGAGVIGGLLLGSAAYDLSQGQDLFDERPFYTAMWGVGLLALGTASAITGWHPAQSYITLPDACPGEMNGTAYDR